VGGGVHDALISVTSKNDTSSITNQATDVNIVGTNKILLQAPTIHIAANPDAQSMYARGAVANGRVTSNIGSLADGVPFMSTGSFTAILGRRYRVRAHGNFGCSNSGARGSGDLYVAGTRFCSSILFFNLAAVGSSSACAEPEAVLECVASPTNNWEIPPGSTTVDFALGAISAAVFQLNASASSPALLTVDDIGF
jgi:hypothetical protein